MYGMRNPMKYSPGVLVGNWYEEMRVREDKVMLYQSKCATNGYQGTREREASHLSETTRVSELKDVVVLGQPLQLVSVATGAALALDTAPKLSPKPSQCLVTAVDTSQPQIRSTWVIQRAKDENNIAYTQQLKEDNTLHYGQRVRIANEDAHPDGFYYLHSGVKDIGHSGSQPLTAALNACKDNTFVIARPGEKREDIRDGGPVRVGDEVVLFHAPTNRPIRCATTTQKTSFGYEFEVSCSFGGENYSRSLGAVTSHPENLFLIGAPTRMAQTNSSAAAAAAAVATLRSRSDRSDAMLMSMSCGMGLDIVMARIREGALRIGGRLGFRVLAKAMGTACNEQRVTPINRQQVHYGVRLMGVAIQPVEMDAIFKRFDRDGNGLIIAQAFLRELRGDMPPNRIEAVVRAFQMLTIEGGGSVDYVDMLNLFKYNAPRHPDVEEGAMSCEEAIFDFINCWPGMNNTTTVTLEDFVAYYTDISPAVESDERFVASVQRCWVIPATDEYKTGLPRRSVGVVHTDDTTETIYLPDSLMIDARDKAAVQRILVQHGVRDIKDMQVTM
ncbi:EF hand family protein [Trypanosoma grayi]|uniref:EF hand family protein n=1 Tax=Trypanosoma grayi TaxID=71804 RepID=UPI0004F49E51|nr:EF hand family protein [Trypanosoma grayi]KEG10597.1 EF hand family protein [Trypanosoma grayi]